MTPTRPDRREVDLRRLVSGFLRMAPDIAVVGEVRHREALPREGYPPCQAAEQGGCRIPRPADGEGMGVSSLPAGAGIDESAARPAYRGGRRRPPGGSTMLPLP